MVLAFVAPHTAGAAPKSKKTTKQKAQKAGPPPKQPDVTKPPVTSTSTPTSVDRKLAKEVIGTRPLSKRGVAKLLASKGIDVSTRDVQGPTRLSPRLPLINELTRLEIRGDIVFEPHRGSWGLVTLGRTLFRATNKPPPIPYEGSTYEERVEDARRLTNPFYPGFKSEATLESNYVTLTFRAAESTSYVVSCAVAGQEVYGAIVEIDGTYDSMNVLLPEHGRVNLAIGAHAGSPSIAVKLAAPTFVGGEVDFLPFASLFSGSYAPNWTLGLCTINPAG